MASARIPTLDPGFHGRVPGLDWPVTTDVGPGLRGVIATETEVVWLDPPSGRLAYRGVPIEALAASADFEEVGYLLLTGVNANDDPGAFQAFRAELRSSRALPRDVVELVRDLDPATHPTRLLRAGISALGCHELSQEDDLSGESHWRELRIVGQTAALLEEIIRHRRGVPSEPPLDGLGLAAGVLRALAGEEAPDPDDVRALDLLWLLYAAHGLDAPTFTSMVVASCRADPYYNVVAGLSALRGPREGGAAETVLDQLRALEDPEHAARWVEETIARRGRIAGFGHRAFHTPDPRVPVLREAAGRVARRKDRRELFEIARNVERAGTQILGPKGVHPNVNLYAAVLYHLLGADAPLVPALSAVARMAGLVALVRESLDDIRLYRPVTRYVGVPERPVDTEGAS